MQSRTVTGRMPMRLVLAVSWTVAMMAAASCSGQTPTAPDGVPATPEPTSTLVHPSTLDSSAMAESNAREPEGPDPLIGMWDTNAEFHGQRQLEGILQIDPPCVYLLGQTGWDAILVGLPRAQTEYDDASGSITVSHGDPVSSGHRVKVMGDYPYQPRPTDACRNDTIFNAWQLSSSSDPFIGTYEIPHDEPAPSYYRIGILLVEPPCLFLVHSPNWYLADHGYDVFLDAGVVLLAINRIQYDPNGKLVETHTGDSVADGDVVVVGPAVGNENPYSKICPGDWAFHVDWVIQAEKDEYLSVEERQHMEALRRFASALWSPEATQRPCEQLGVCPRTPSPPNP